MVLPVDVGNCTFSEQSERKSSDTDLDILAVLIRGPRGLPAELIWF